MPFFPVAVLWTNILNNSTMFSSATFAVTEKSKWEEMVRKKGRKAVGERAEALWILT